MVDFSCDTFRRGLRGVVMTKVLTDEERDIWMPSVGARLRLVREIADVTQVQMAEWLDANQGTISKWEDGRRLLPPYKALVVCARFRVSMDYIYRGTLWGVHPALAADLVSRMPELAANTKRIARGMGTAPP